MRRSVIHDDDGTAHDLVDPLNVQKTKTLVHEAAHYVADRLEPSGVRVTSIARGVPVGGELDYLDDGTLAAALQSRR